MTPRCTTKTIDVLAFANYHTDLIKNFGFVSSWDHHKGQLKNHFFVQGHQPWRVFFYFNKGKPLNKHWVSDTNKFFFDWTFSPWEKFRELEFNEVGAYEKEDDPRSFNFEHKLHFEMKGYTNRVKDSMKNERNVFIIPGLGKKIDLLEIGYSLKRDFNNHKTVAGIRVAGGTNFDKSHYIKLKQNMEHTFELSQNYHLQVSGKGGMIFGKNVPIQ